jgi:2Fe-2S ferredoxin
MPKITYIEFNGTPHEVDVDVGASVMEGAIHNDVPGIEAECGGCCSCATCHVYVDSKWIAATGKADPLERDMLESVMDLRGGSRLSCQITVTDEMDGLVVKLPELQI